MFYFINVLDGIFLVIVIVVFIFIFFKIRSEKKVEAEKITLLKKCDKCEIILNNGETYLFDKNTNNINFKTKMIKIDKNLIMFDMIDKINLLSMDSIKMTSRVFTMKQNPIILMPFTGDNVDEIQKFIGDEFKIEVIIDGMELRITNKNDLSKHGDYWFLVKGKYVRSVVSKNIIDMKILEIYSEKYISENFDEKI